MPRVILLMLDLEIRKKLEIITSRSVDWRERERAKTLLHLDDGLPTADVAELMKIHIHTVSRTRRDWFTGGLNSLVDSARSGAPKKITSEQLAKLVEAASAEPLTARELLAKHMDDGGTKVHLSTMTSALRASGMVWKRTRHSLKKTK